MDSKVVTKEQLIRLLAENSNIPIVTIRFIYDSLEDKLKDLLSEANLSQDITVKLFNGITINSKFIPQKERLNNLTGEKISAKSKIKVKSNVTRNYCESLFHEKNK